MEYRLVAPLRVPVSGKQDWILNMNNYKGVHFMKLNKAKVAYKEIMREQIETLPVLSEPISVTYVLYPKTKRLGDLMNVVSIHSKFLLDALQEYGKITNDTWFEVPEEVTAYGYVDKADPRLEIIIRI